MATPEAFEPYAPLDTLKAVAPDVWIVDGPEIRFDYLGLKLPFPTRMTVIRLPEGGLWVHSPTQPDRRLIDAMLGLGEVRWLIAPNTIHYWWIPEWKALFPGAEVHAVPGLLLTAKRDVPIDRDLASTAPRAWRDVIRQRIVRGDMLTEVVFFHGPSRTLVLTDLIENFETWRVRHWFLRLLLRFSGAADPDGKAPFDMQGSFWRNRREVRAVAQQMIDWAPERVILSHGRWYERNGTEELRRAFRWTGL